MPAPINQVQKALRKLWLWGPSRKAAVTAARVSRGEYQCAKCEEFVGRKEFQVDHIVPVGPIPGSPRGKETSWDGYMARLFCDESGLRVLCKPCHKARSKICRHKE